MNSRAPPRVVTRARDRGERNERAPTGKPLDRRASCGSPPDEPTPRPLTFAFPLADGRWLIHPGTVLVLNGLVRALEVPGLGTRSGPGESGGLTGVFHIVYRVRDQRGCRTGAVVRWEVEEGRVTRTEEAAADVELVEGSRGRGSSQAGGVSRLGCFQAFALGGSNATQRTRVVISW